MHLPMPPRRGRWKNREPRTVALLEWRRELEAGGELVDMFLGKELDGRLGRRLAPLDSGTLQDGGSEFCGQTDYNQI